VLLFLAGPVCFCCSLLLLNVVIVLQMVDGHTLFDYNVGINEIIQILVRKPAAVTESSATEQAATTASETENVSVRCTSFVLLVKLEQC